MSDDLRDLYQEVILDHHRRPRNNRHLPEANADAEGHNPLCGDRLKVYVRREGDRLADVCFEGLGCAICIASASMMTEHVKGRQAADVERLTDAFHRMVTDQADSKPTDAVGGKNVGQARPLNEDDLGKLKILAGVRQYPMRVKCATLAWHTLRAALRGQGEPVSTE